MHTFFSTAAEVSGTLMGLLFVSISLRYDLIMGKQADSKNRFVAARGFTGLLDALAISLLALIPSANLGTAAVIVGGLCLVQTLRRGAGVTGRSFEAIGNLILSVASFGTQVGAGIWLLVGSHSSAGDTIAYTLFGAIAAGVMRAWELLQPGENE
jgi:hypothetical protein